MEEKLDRIIELLESGEIAYWFKVLTVTILVYLGIRLLWTLIVPKGEWKK